MQGDKRSVKTFLLAVMLMGISLPTWGQVVVSGGSSSVGSMTWPSGAGIAVYGGSGSWGTSLTAPASPIVGTSDAQALTNKNLTGVGNTFPSSLAVDSAVFHKAISGEFFALTVKTTPVSGDIIPIEDSAASNAKKYITIGTLPGGGMIYPGAGIPQSTGSAWGTSITAGTGVVTALTAGMNASTGFQGYNVNTAIGPGASTANHVATFSNSDGKTLADSGGVVRTDSQTTPAGSAINVAGLNSSGTMVSTAAAFYQGANKTPAAPNSTSVYTMQGLSGSITPSRTGTIHITINGTVNETTGTAAGVGAFWQISYGTSTAPTANSALTGTQVGPVQQYENPATVTAANVFFPFSISVIVTGLTVGTAYWIDLAAKSITTASYVGFTNVQITAFEQ